MFQSSGVKIRADGETVPTAGLLENRPMLTSAVGSLVSATEKVAVPPTSVVISPEVGVTTNPA